MVLAHGARDRSWTKSAPRSWRRSAAKNTTVAPALSGATDWLLEKE